MPETYLVMETQYSFELSGHFREKEKDAIILAILAVEKLFNDDSTSLAIETNLGTLAQNVNPRKNCTEINYTFLGRHCGYKYRGNQSKEIQVFELIEKDNFPDFITFLQRTDILKR